MQNVTVGQRTGALTVMGVIFLWFLSSLTYLSANYELTELISAYFYVSSAAIFLFTTITVCQLQQGNPTSLRNLPF